MVVGSLILNSSGGGGYSSPSNSSPSEPGDAGIPLYGDPSQPLEIIQTTPLETHDDIEAAFQTMVEVDPGTEALLSYAMESGDISSGYQTMAGDKTWFSNGSMYVALVVGDGTPENSVVVLQAYMEDREYGSGGTLLARLSGTEDNPTLVLYTREGSVEIGEGGVVSKEFSPDVSPLVAGNSITRPSGLSAPCLNGNCTTSTWDDYMSCIKDVAGTPTLVGLSCAASLTALKAAWGTGPWGVGAAAIAVAASCGAPWLYCIAYAGDDAPVYEVLSASPDPEGRFGVCVFQGEQEVLQVYRPYEVRISWDDDRRPFADYGVRTVNTLHFGGMMQESATDCGGNTTYAEIDVPASELIEEYPCADICVDPMDGTAHCDNESAPTITPAEPPGPDPTSAPQQRPQASGTVVYQGLVVLSWNCLDLPVCVPLENEMRISFPLEGGPVSGLIVYSHRENWSADCPDGSFSTFIEINGTYDAASGEMSGTALVNEITDSYMLGGMDNCEFFHDDHSYDAEFQASYVPGGGVSGKWMYLGYDKGAFNLTTRVSGP
ncbi:MAG: hypothetical protein JXA25_11305 [Anaerolineales bacterium]|nr:hypothetical protein [Anaerolineales bacterium]